MYCFDSNILRFQNNPKQTGKSKVYGSVMEELGNVFSKFRKSKEKTQDTEKIKENENFILKEKDVELSTDIVTKVTTVNNSILSKNKTAQDRSSKESELQSAIEKQNKSSFESNCDFDINNRLSEQSTMKSGRSVKKLDENSNVENREIKAKEEQKVDFENRLNKVLSLWMVICEPAQLFICLFYLTFSLACTYIV